MGSLSNAPRGSNAERSYLRMEDGRRATAALCAGELLPGEVFRLATGSRLLQMLSSKDFREGRGADCIAVYLSTGERKDLSSTTEVVRVHARITIEKED